MGAATCTDLLWCSPPPHLEALAPSLSRRFRDGRQWFRQGSSQVPCQRTAFRFSSRTRQVQVWPEHWPAGPAAGADTKLRSGEWPGFSSGCCWLAVHGVLSRRQSLALGPVCRLPCLLEGIFSHFRSTRWALRPLPGDGKRLGRYLSASPVWWGWGRQVTGAGTFQSSFPGRHQDFEFVSGSLPGLRRR